MIEELYRITLDTLRNHLQAAGMPYTEDENELLFADHRLGLSIAFEGFEQQGGQVIAPLDVQIHLDGDEGDRFRVGTLGVGGDRLHALRDGVEEWMLLAASPVLAALGATLGKRRDDKTPTQLAGWDFFPGRIGIRGKLPEPLAPGGAFYRSLLQSLQKSVSRWNLPERWKLRSIYLMAASGDGAVQVQSAIDGFVSEELSQELSKLNWPVTSEPYMYKQLFVLRAGK